MDKADIATQLTAYEIVLLNQKIARMLQQLVRSSELTLDTPASSMPSSVIQLMKQVDALLLVIGHTPQYTHIITQYGMEKTY